MNNGRILPGVLAVLLIAVLSYAISKMHASFDALVISIILGLFAGNMVGNREYFERGVEGSLRVFLPAGIALYGSQLDFGGINTALFGVILLVFAGMFSATMFTARAFNIDNKMALLLASGLSVCGASAIAVISPLIKAGKEDTSVSIISIMMVGLTGMILYPLLHQALSLTNNEFNFLAGTTLPMLGQVKVTSEHVLPAAFPTAVAIKLFRVSLLFLPAAIAVLLSGGRGGRFEIPWFVVVFAILAGLVNFTNLLDPIAALLGVSSTFALSAGLAAVGFSADFDSIIEKGIAPLSVVFLPWMVIVLLICLARYLF